jgi:hypothetical protein
MLATRLRECKGDDHGHFPATDRVPLQRVILRHLTESQLTVNPQLERGPDRLQKQAPIILPKPLGLVPHQRLPQHGDNSLIGVPILMKLLDDAEGELRRAAADILSVRPPQVLQCSGHLRPVVHGQDAGQAAPEPLFGGLHAVNLVAEAGLVQEPAQVHVHEEGLVAEPVLAAVQLDQPADEVQGRTLLGGIDRGQQLPELAVSQRLQRELQGHLVLHELQQAGDIDIPADDLRVAVPGHLPGLQVLAHVLADHAEYLPDQYDVRLCVVLQRVPREVLDECRQVRVPLLGRQFGVVLVERGFQGGEQVAPFALFLEA